MFYTTLQTYISFDRILWYHVFNCPVLWIFIIIYPADYILNMSKACKKMYTCTPAGFRIHDILMQIRINKYGSGSDLVKTTSNFFLNFKLNIIIIFYRNFFLKPDTIPPFFTFWQKPFLKLTCFFDDHYIHLVWFGLKKKYLKMEYFLWKKLIFPWFGFGFATGSGSISSTVVWIRIRQNDTDPDQ